MFYVPRIPEFAFFNSGQNNGKFDRIHYGIMYNCLDSIYFTYCISNDMQIRKTNARILKAHSYSKSRGSI